MTTYSNIGVNIDLLIKQGGTFELRGIILDPVSPVDITDCVFVAKLKRHGLDPTVVADFAYSIMDAVGGKYKLNLSAETTAAFVCGELITDADSKYVWDLEMIDTLGQVIPLHYGDVAVYRNV